nr:hypothetical protein [Sphingomonas daechungensis]
MIAHYEMDPVHRRRGMAEPLDHSGRLRPAVDQVAEKDQVRLEVVSPQVALNFLQQPLQRLQAAMHVANRVDAHPAGTP